MCTLGPGSVLCRQELGESSLLKLCQSWEERAEEQLTLKQEEGEAGWASGAPGRGRQNPQSFGVHRPGLGVVYRSYHCPVPATALGSGPSGILWLEDSAE